MRTFNEACNHIAEVAFKNRCANKIALQKIIYKEVRERFGLSAQMTVRAISKVVEAYKQDKNIQPNFREYGAMVYDQRILGWKGLDKVSLLTLEGRIIIPTIICDYHRSRLDRIRGQADLIYVKGTFYLCVVVDVPEPDKIKPVGALGIDLGIVNLATDSDGKSYSGEAVDRVREKNAKLRRNLQKRGSKSAKRHLKKVSGRERRFATNINHIISKKVVSKAKDTLRAIALENLEGIRDRVAVKKAQRRRHHSWSFNQLRQFIEYKAALAGVVVELVDPRGTSRTCPRCGFESKKNRPTRDTFKCKSCGFAEPSDYVGAINIASRAAVSQPIVATLVSHC
jgi:IS605 OrfB family transposase